MRLTVRSWHNGNLRVLTITEPRSLWAAVFCGSMESGSGKRLLTPVRFHAGDIELVHSEPARNELIRQTLNLNRKIAAIDRLRLTDMEFAKHFDGSRLFLYGDISRCAGEGLEFSHQALELLRRRIGRQMIAQIDYDQRRLHPNLGAMLDSIDFQTKHSPSAVATVVCFHTILQRVGVVPTDVTWMVKGAGAVGGRIVKQVAATCRGVYVQERLEERREALLSLPNVTVVSGEAISKVRADAVVFAADSGSLSLDVAHALAVNGSVAAVGGPEAGLDHNLQAVQSLTARGKWFVPSVLCGSLGVVSNLEECLGIEPNLEVYARRLESRAAVMADRDVSTGRPFHQLCLDMLEGRPAV